MNGEKVTALWFGSNGPSAAPQKPFFFKKHVYAVCHQSTVVDTIRFDLNIDGSPYNFTWLKDRATTVNGCWGSVATCIYRGRVYLFYDSVHPDNKQEFHLRYKTTVDPDTGWLPADGNGLATGFVGSYAGCGPFACAPCIAATVMNDRIYLFWYAGDRILYATYDGTWWGNPLVLQKDYHPIFAVCTAQSGGSPLIYFLGRSRADAGTLVFTLIYADGRVLTSNRMGTNWVRADNMISIGYGSIAGVQGNMLQVFGNNGGGKRCLRRISVDADSVRSVTDDWSDTNIVSDGFNRYRPCDVVEVALLVDTIGNIRQFLVVLAYSPGPGPEAQVGVYQSDYFRCDYTSKVIDTGDVKANTVQPDTWTLLGVIEGVPPFTRNGTGGKETTSVVIYGNAKTKLVSVRTEHEISVTVGAGGGVAELWNVSAELASTFNAVTSAYTRVDETLHQQLRNADHNSEGVKGWLVVLKPRLVGRRYARVSEDGKHLIARLYVVSVVGASFHFEEYNLANPKAGMLARHPSSDYAYWSNVAVPELPPITTHIMPQLDASLGGKAGHAELVITHGSTQTTSGSVRATLKGGVTLEKMFDVKAEASYRFQWTTELTSEFSDAIVAEMELVDGGDTSEVYAMTVQPYWLIAPPEFRLDPHNKPFWIPDSHVKNATVPWCLTWRVTSWDPVGPRRRVR